MTRPLATCERCGATNESVGPWRDHGFDTLCGQCKAYVTLEAPGVREELERAIRAAMRGLTTDPEKTT